MRRPCPPTLRVAACAAMLVLPSALLQAACDSGSEATAPEVEIGSLAIAEASHRPNSGDHDGIMAVVEAVTAAWTAKDAAAYAAAYANDVQVVTPPGGLLLGRQAFQAQHAFLFNGPFAGSTQTILVTDIRFLTGTTAIVYQDVSLTGYAFLPPTLPSSNGVVRNRVTWVVLKRAGTWEIVFQQMTPIL